MDPKFKALMSILSDYYSPMLSEKQREIMDMYYSEDYSLFEISEITGISRQGVRDAVKRSESILTDCENKLHLYSRAQKRKEIIDSVKKDLEGKGHLDDEMSKLLDSLVE